MEKIYHYTKLSTAIEFILPKMQLRTNSLENMNDPKENQPWAFGGSNLDYKKMYPETYTEETHFEHAYRFGSEIKENVQALCFVNNKDNEGFSNGMMWAHYSASHRGVCLEIDLEEFLKENSSVLSKSKFENVIYDKLKRIDLHTDQRSSKEEKIKFIIENQFYELFLKKDKCWEHENEKRLLIFETKTKYLKIEESLTGIYTGLLMPNNYLPSIDAHIKSDHVKLYDLYFAEGCIKEFKRDKGDFRPFVMRKFMKSNIPQWN